MPKYDSRGVQEQAPAEIPPPDQEDVPAARRVSIWRAVLLGLLLVPINAFWITVIEVRWYGLDGTCLPLFVTPVFLLFVLVLLNLAWRKRTRRPTAGLQQEELLLVYIMLVISCTFAGHDTLQDLFGNISRPYWFASPSNRWQQLFFQYLPRGLVVTDHEALAGFFQGHVNIYGPDGQRYLMSWLVPLAIWGVFFLTLFGMYLCVNTLLRKGWIHNEKLTFPIVQLPIAMTAENAGVTFFKNPVMWAGFGVAFLVSTLNGLQMLFPALPSVNLKLYDVSPYFTTPPWNSIGQTLTSFYPFGIGLSYFMPLDLSFSCWTFFVLARVFRILGGVYGWYGNNSGFPYFQEQATGAWFGLGVMLILTGRSYWRGVFQTAWEGARADDPAEARRYRGALAGLVAGIVLLAIFSALVGLSAWVAVLFFGIVFLLGFVITRVRAECGTQHEIYWVNPEQAMVTLFGSQTFGGQNLTLISVLYWFNRCYRNHPMPNQLEAFKIMDGRRTPFGGVVGVLCLAGVVSLLSSYWANLHVTYAWGGSAKDIGFKGFVGDEAYSRLQGWLTNPTPPASTGLYYLIGGLVFVVALSLLRNNLEWWPLHPIGYALAVSKAIEYFAVPIFIAWLAKFIILRYGGVKLHRQALPFFLGLILGDYTIGALWSIISIVLGVPTYKIFL